MKTRLIKKGYLFKLIDFSKPVIVNHKTMFSDNEKGGILLKYLVQEVYYITIFKRDIVFSEYLYKSDNCVFQKSYFNPLKQAWNREAYKISKVYWGRKNHLLTKLWLEVSSTFKDIYSITTTELKMIPQCKDKNLIKQLESQKERFILSINKNQ